MQNVIQIDPKQITTNGNIRHSSDVKADAELRASIEKHGLLSPLVAREVEGGGYMLIAGHRRLEALRGLGWKKFPIILVDASDQAALEIQVTENLQRQDLGPLDEAKAFQSLWELHREWSVKDLAGRVDKSVAYVTKALSLLGLSDKTHKLIESGKLTPEHGHQIARVEGKQRETIERFATTANEYTKELPRLDELIREIEKSVERDLDRAVFPKDVANYGGTETPACVECPANTGNQSALFAGAEKGSCTNPGCYTKRTNAWYADMREGAAGNLEGVKFVGITSQSGYSSEGPSDIKGFPIVEVCKGAGPSKKTAAALKEKPGKYGFAILKPSRWDTATKKPSIVIVALDKKAKAVRQDEPDHDRMRAGMRGAHHALATAAWKSGIKITDDHRRELLGSLDDELLGIISEVEGSPLKKIKWSSDDVLAAILINARESWNQNPKEWEALGLKDAKKIADDARALAVKEYDAKKELAKAK